MIEIHGYVLVLVYLSHTFKKISPLSETLTTSCITYDAGTIHGAVLYIFQWVVLMEYM